MLRIHVMVRGRVQAVGFRYFAYQLAHQYELTGWVKNLYDGTVELEVQGNSKAIEKFLVTLKKGNGYSRVTDIKVDDIQPVSHELKFVILQ